MSRYFVDVTDGRRVLDRRGFDLPDASAACVEARDIAVTLGRLQRELGGHTAGGRVVVVDADGHEILALSLPCS